MPLYEYACAQCAHDFETLLFPGEKADDILCPACQSREVARKLSATAAPQTKGPLSLPRGGACTTTLPPCRPDCCRLG